MIFKAMRNIYVNVEIFNNPLKRSYYVLFLSIICDSVLDSYMWKCCTATRMQFTWKNIVNDNKNSRTPNAFRVLL